MSRNTRILLGFALLSGAASVHAADTGWYLGLGAGASNFSGDLPSQVAAAYRNNSVYTLQSARLTDSGDTSAQLFVGYRFLPWLGAELGYTDLGSARSRYVLRANVGLNYPTPTLSGDYGAHDVHAALLASWRVAPRVELLARGGVSDTRLSYDERGFDINGAPYQFRARTRTRSVALAGIGAAWNFTPSLALRVDLDRRFGIGERFALNPVGNGRFDHVDAYTVNLIWKP